VKFTGLKNQSGFQRFSKFRLCVSRFVFPMKDNRQRGFTLIELVVTLVVLSILALGTVPLLQNAVRRQKEQRLRETLGDIRRAIDEFHRDANGACLQSGNPIPTPNNNRLPNNFGGINIQSDPRSRVVIADCKIFEVDNYDRYPPSLEILVEGVEVKPRSAGGAVTDKTTSGGVFDKDNAATGDRNATDESATEPKKKFYLREVPIDPITGKNEWKLRSSYQEADSESWDNINVFDVRSQAEGEALSGEKYSDF
jgi:general secretion pathway protein G